LKPGDQEIEANLALAYANADLPEKAIPHFSAAFNLSQQSGQPPTGSLLRGVRPGTGGHR